MSEIIKPGDRAFYINRNRYVESESHVAVGVEGFYSGKAIKPGVGVTRSFGIHAPNPNLLTDLGLNAMGTSPALNRMHLGTGTNPPAESDTALQVFGVNVSNAPTITQGVASESPYFGWQRYTWTSAVGGATGNWTEIGISNQPTSGNLRSRALILDSGGNPVAFPVLADEQFQGTYEFRCYAPSADSLSTVSIGPNSYDTVTRALKVTSESNGGWVPAIGAASPLFVPSASASLTRAYTGDLSPVTGLAPQGVLSGNVSSASASTYSEDDYYLDTSFRFGSGSAGSFRTLMLFMTCGTLQVQLDPALNKLTTEEVIHNQRISWARR